MLRSLSSGGTGLLARWLTWACDLVASCFGKTPFDRLALYIGRISAIVCLILTILWCKGTDTTEGYLGGIDPYSSSNKNVFNWHPILMVLGIVCLSGWSMTAYRMKIFGFSMSRNLHVFFHLGAKVCLTLGVKAAWDYKDLDDDSSYLVHMASLHSMFGLATTILLVQNDMIGSFVFLVPAIPSRFRILYRPHHMFFGKAAYIVAMLTVATGFVEKQTYIGCLESRPYKDQNALDSYGKISEGCRIASGAGIMVIVALLCNLFALQKPHGRVSGQLPSNVADDSDMSRNTLFSDTTTRESHINSSKLNIDGGTLSDYRGSI